LNEAVEPLGPNEEIVEAMKAARRCEFISVDSMGALLSSLNSEV
jgi:hypothetical protein